VRRRARPIDTESASGGITSGAQNEIFGNHLTRSPQKPGRFKVRFNGLKRDLADYLHDYNFDREHHGRITNGRRPADIVYEARKMEPR
jgi:hypothetical protein